MDYKEKLKSQIKDAHGKLVYTYTTHQKQIECDEFSDKWMKNTQIILSAVSTTGIMTSIIWSQKWLAIVSGIISAISLGLTLYAKEWNLCDKISKHNEIVNELWLLREEYVSLLTDIDNLEENIIVVKRDDLMKRTSVIYKKAPRTSNKSYMMAQKALKQEEAQYFTQAELDLLEPGHLRTNGE